MEKSTFYLEIDIQLCYTINEYFVKKKTQTQIR